ncbi:MAG: sensor histidine kinase [Bacteroidota bacterium]
MNWKRIGTHLFFWIVILFWTSTIYDYNGKFGWHFVWFNLVRFPVIIASTYLVIYYFLPKWIVKEKRYGLFTLTFLLIFLLATVLDRIVIGSNFIINLLADTGLTYYFFNEIPIIRNAFILLSIIGLASGIRFFKLYLSEEKRKHELEAIQLNTQLNFLKTQINPHFLFNALNNLYSMAIEKQQEEIATGLDNLSGIMQYLTYESNAEKVPLQKEVQLLQNYIEIQHLRLEETDDTTISFQVKGVNEAHQIAPVILLPLIENAFKHGVRPEEKCLVNIQLLVEDHQLKFNVQNTIFEHSTALLNDRGIGLENVRKRLALIYPNQHQFVLTKTDSDFIVELRINTL